MKRDKIIILIQLNYNKNIKELIKIKIIFKIIILLIKFFFIT